MLILVYLIRANMAEIACMMVKIITSVIVLKDSKGVNVKVSHNQL